MLMETVSFKPMPFMYQYRRKYLETIGARFETGIINEDELWMPRILCQAEKMVIVNHEFYFYRVYEKSVTYSTSLAIHLQSIFMIADKLYDFADQYTFTGENRELKSWLYVDIAKLYHYASTLIVKKKDSSTPLPDHQLDRLKKELGNMTPNSQELCNHFMKNLEAIFKLFTETDMSILPMISCLCVTHNKPHLLERAIFCFNHQTYSNKQMVIVYEESDEQTCTFITGRTLGDEYKLVKIDKDAKLTLGDLRNISVREADGSYVCQWDDDDWYSSDRLTEQMDFLILHQKSGCVLSQWVMFDDFTQKSYLSYSRPWEGSILCLREVILQNPYPSLSKGEDTNVILGLYKQGEISLIKEMPHLYIYTIHGSNTWEYEHFIQLLKMSQELPESYSKDVMEALSEYLQPDQRKPSL